MNKPFQKSYSGGEAKVEQIDSQTNRSDYLKRVTVQTLSQVVELTLQIHVVELHMAS